MSLPLTDSFVGDAVVTLIPLGLIYSLLSDDVCIIDVSCDCCSSCIFVDVWETFDDDSSNDGTINGNMVWEDVSIVELDSFSLLVLVAFVTGIAFVALSIAIGWWLSLISDD